MPRTPPNIFTTGWLCSPGLLARACTLALGLVFLLSAFLKAVRPNDTFAALGALFDPNSTAPSLIIHALVAVEMSLAGALLAHARPAATLKTASALLTIFTIWIACLILIGWREGCGCGSWTPNLDPIAALWISLARNIALLLLAWIGLRSCRLCKPIYNASQRAIYTTF